MIRPCAASPCGRTSNLDTPKAFSRLSIIATVCSTAASRSVALVSTCNVTCQVKGRFARSSEQPSPAESKSNVAITVVSFWRTKLLLEESCDYGKAQINNLGLQHGDPFDFNFRIVI